MLQHFHGALKIGIGDGGDTDPWGESDANFAAVHDVHAGAKGIGRAGGDASHAAAVQALCDFHPLDGVAGVIRGDEGVENVGHVLIESRVDDGAANFQDRADVGGEIFFHWLGESHIRHPFSQNCPRAVQAVVEGRDWNIQKCRGLALGALPNVEEHGSVALFGREAAEMGGDPVAILGMISAVRG